MSERNLDFFGREPISDNLVVVPCGRAKIWARNPSLGPTPAREAYVGGQFAAARRYAEAQGSGWVILSAKYGFISPDTLIENYDVAFSKLINGYYRPVAMPGQVSEETLREQAVKLAAQYQGREVVCLVADAYRLKIETAFHGLPLSLSFPIAGKRQHAMMRWLADGTRTVR